MATSEAYMSVVGKHLTSQASQLGLRVIQTTLPTHQLNVSFGGNYIPGTKNADGDSAVDESLPWYGTGENAMNVRRALSKAIDRDALNEALYDGRGEPAYASLFHPQLGPWRDEWEGGYEEIHGYDPEGAKKLLDEAGYPNGISGYRWAAFTPGESLETNTLIEAVLDQWTKIGVSLDVEQTQRDDWFANLRNRTTAGFVYAWRSPWQPAESSLEQYVYSKGPAECCSTEEFDRLFEDLFSESDPLLHDEKLRKIGDTILDTTFFIPLFWEYTDIIVNPNVVAEYKTTGIWHIHDWEYAKSVRGPSERWWEC